jgi:hypothetical protein
MCTLVKGEGAHIVLLFVEKLRRYGTPDDYPLRLSEVEIC